MTRFINPASFQLETTEDEGHFITERGTVEVTIGRETRRLPAVITTFPEDFRAEAEIAVYGNGLFGRYRTGDKAWPARVSQTHWRDGKVSESGYFGRDDRSGRFQKINGIFFG